MKKMILSFGLLILVSTMFAQNKLPDKGISNETHRKNIGKTLFSKTQVFFNKEINNTWLTSFKWGEPIYARMYWAEGFNNVYQNESMVPPSDGDGRYKIFFYANGKIFKSYIGKSVLERTSMPICLFRGPNDTYNWNYMNEIANNLSFFNEGNNTVKVEIYAFSFRNDKISKLLSSGSFTINMPKNIIEKAKQTNFSNIKTRFTSGDNWTEWNITTNYGGNLKTQWKNKEEWIFTVGSYSGAIKTKYSNDYTLWILQTKMAKVEIKQRWNNDWKEWIISEGNNSCTVKTRYSNGNDAWQEWQVAGNKGTMTIKTRYSSGDDAWEEWNITDNMPNEKVEFKMATIFIAIFQAMPK